jgi:hypothetical protein
MTPELAISQLDRQLTQHGESVTLIRYVLAAVGRLGVPVTMLAFVRGYKPEAIVEGSGIVMGDTKVTLSPTGFAAAQWPASHPSNPTTEDIRIPIKNDTIVISGRPTTVQGTEPVRIGDTIVRFDVRVRG